MQIVQLLGGALLLGIVFIDAFVTTLAVSAGAGPLTSRVSGALWRGMLRLHRQDRESSWLTGGGTALLTTTVLMWVLLLWAGWALVFYASGAVVDSKTGVEAGAADVIYFAGFTVFTLGTGDYVASAPLWRIVSALASFSGLFLITLAITYLISVVSAVVMRRALAIEIHSLGETASDIVLGGWRSDGFGQLYQQQLINLTPNVAASAEQHLAYPVLNNFHTSTARLSAPRAVASLDDALTVMHAALAADFRPDNSAVEPLRFAIERYQATATGTSWSPSVGAPPLPSVRRLADAGLPLLDESTFTDAVRANDNRRTMLHRLVASDGWSWPST